MPSQNAEPVLAMKCRVSGDVETNNCVIRVSLCFVKDSNLTARLSNAGGDQETNNCAIR